MIAGFSRYRTGDYKLNGQIALLLIQDGIVNGAVYALLALAIVLVFVVTRVLFLPQGEFVTYGALSLAALQLGRTPGIVQRAMRKWTSFLAVRDERLILLNRIAPAVPLTGAFIAVCGWDLRRSLGYVLIGGAVKYAALLGVAAVLGITLSPETGRVVTAAEYLGRRDECLEAHRPDVWARHRTAGAALPGQSRERRT